MKIIVGYRLKETYPDSPPENTTLTVRNEYRHGVLWRNSKDANFRELEEKIIAWPKFWEPIMVEKDIITDKQF